MAKQGLTKSGFKDPIGLKLERTRREEKGKERRRGEEEEEGEKFKQSSKQVWNLGFCMETHLVYESYEIMHEFPCFDGYPLVSKS